MTSMTDPIEVSNTEINTFAECRRKWWLTYYLKYHAKEVSLVGPLPLGSRVHKALEVYYKDGYDLVGTYNQLLDDDLALAVEIGEDLAALTTEGELGRIMLEGYLDWLEAEGVLSNYKVIGVEDKLSMPMLDGRVHVIGKIDLRVQDQRDGTNLVLDHKTVAQPGTYSRWAHMNPQLMTYQTLDYINTPESQRIAGGEFHLLKKVKRGPRAVPPFYERIEVRHNVFTLRSFWVRLQGQLSQMTQARDLLDEGADHRLVVYPSPSTNCSWKCPFFRVCPLFDDGSAAMEMLEADFEVGDPYAYYSDDTEKEV